MRLPYFGHLCKGFIGGFERLLPVYLLGLSLIFSFSVGYIEASADQKPPIFIQENNISTTIEGETGVVASKSGTTFYYPWCSGRNRIKPANERWFSGPTEALKYGLKPAQNCLGL